MPGIFGAIGVRDETFERLAAEFARPWGGCEVARFGGGGIGGHAFGSRAALHHGAGGSHFAVDGEAGLYGAAKTAARGPLAPLWSAGPHGRRLDAAARGNVAIADPRNRSLTVLTEWTGTFPLYWAEAEGGLLVSSHLMPLARILRPEPDPLGIVAFLLNGYTVGGRTAFAGIQRLQPGQSLRFVSPAVHAEVAETSRLWSAAPDGLPGPGEAGVREAAETAWGLLGRALAGSLDGISLPALMLSGGWDSRTLLGGIAEAGRPLLCYAHGDVASRELDLARRLAAGANRECVTEPIDARCYEPGWLREGFDRVENVIYPHWHRAGDVLASRGADGVTAGVYGEILGGHYGPGMVFSGAARIASIVGTIIDPRRAATEGGAADAISARDALRFRSLERPWYLDRDWWGAFRDPLPTMNAEIDSAVDRFAARGVPAGVRQVEAFVAEHRGTQYINAQLLSCRRALDVALPFADREFLVWSASLPLGTKIHNRLNREMLRRHASPLARLPLAATLTPASSPLLLQEASRFARHALEAGRWRLHHASGGRIAAPRLGWVQFEFLKGGRALDDLIEDLRAPLWDRAALHGLLRDLRSGRSDLTLHPVSDQLMKITTIDLTLRG